MQHASTGVDGVHMAIELQLEHCCGKLEVSTFGGLLQEPVVPPSPPDAWLLELHATPITTMVLASSAITFPPVLMSGRTIVEEKGSMAPSRVSFSDQVVTEAKRLGFDAVGIADARVPIELDVARYESFVEAGMHGAMTWLASPENARARTRLDGDEILEGARSIVCVARRYPRDAENGEVSRSIARYARGRDYHKFLRKRLRRLATFIRSLGAQARPLLDEEPILERAWAARAGLGFVGKNGMLIVPGLGSMLMLGEVVTTLDLQPTGQPIADRCGSCTRCLDACPTGAFERPFVLDPRKCISYLTIEQRGAVPVEMRESIGTHLFGCDDCQTVCPFNAGTGARASTESAIDGDPFAPMARWSRVRLEELLALDDEQWELMSEGSPLRRAGRTGLARNAAIVLGNRRDASALSALEQAAAHHDDATVRESARWAIDRIHSA
ncbi:MAG TPA: tRNA epoxyqueuosine(34) reductase QueG [Polyangiaceae bacterium]